MIFEIVVGFFSGETGDADATGADVARKSNECIFLASYFQYHKIIWIIIFISFISHATLTSRSRLTAFYRVTKIFVLRTERTKNYV